jgi:hypothetical protein
MLPSDEESYASGSPISTEYFDENGNICKSVTSANFKPQASAMGELVKLFGLWYVFKSTSCEPTTVLNVVPISQAQ